ncbi:MAG: APC family permease [Halobacteriales archaeon]
MSGDDTLFVREATGLVREWSSYDAWIYAFLSVNIVTLGFYIWTFNAFIPQGSPILGTLIAIVILTLQNVIYATLVSSMPRVGGDYVWQSRLLSGFWGFVLSWPGWVFILWLWVPIYGAILSWLVLAPISALTGNVGLATFWSSSNGLFVSSMIVVVFVFIYVSLGMRWYARIQKALFYVGVVGMLLFVGMLLSTNPSSFQSAFNSQVGAWLPAQDITYQGIVQGTDVNFAPMWNLNWGASFMLIPMLLFWIMWTVWGATLFGEVREAGEFRKMFGVFEAALIAGGGLAIVLWFIFDAAIGYEFYQALNYNYFVGSGKYQWLSSPTLLAAIATGGGWLGVLEVVLMAGWFFSWSGTVFLSSTRVIFATAFDRTVPEILAEVKFRWNAPLYAILMMAIPAAILTVIYFYVPGFQTLTLDATFAIAITYFGTTIACLLFPWRRPELFDQNPVSDWEIAGVPLTSIVAAVYAVILLVIFYLWATRDVYGINNVRSAGFMVFLYLLAAVIYLVMRYRRRQEGVDLSEIHAEIPKD